MRVKLGSKRVRQKIAWARGTALPAHVPHTRVTQFSSAPFGSAGLTATWRPRRAARHPEREAASASAPAQERPAAAGAQPKARGGAQHGHRPARGAGALRGPVGSASPPLLAHSSLLGSTFGQHLGRRAGEAPVGDLARAGHTPQVSRAGQAAAPWA